MRAELFEVKPSKIYIYLLVFIHLGALVCVFLSTIPITMVFVFSLLTGINFIWQFRRHMKIRNFMWGKQKLIKPLVCTPWVVGLNCEKRAVIIFFDSMSQSAFRRLRVLLINGGVRYEN